MGLQRVCFQVWVIANKVQGSRSLSRGTVCRRTGVQPHEPKGQGWDYGIGVSRAGLRAASLAVLCTLWALRAVPAGTWHWGQWDTPVRAP